MTEAEWTECEDLLEMLYVLNYDYRQPAARKLRLFACACCQSVWPDLRDDNVRNALEVAQRLADGLADERDCEAAILALDIPDDPNLPIGPAVRCAMGCLAPNIKNSCAAVANDAAWANGPRAEVTERRRQCDLLRDIFGPLPFRPAIVEGHWLTWNGGAVVKLAEAVYDNWDFARLPILADALEDAGCIDPAFLPHLRGSGLHVRGCWAIDMLLGKT
jgi:hypothetical protein